MAFYHRSSRYGRHGHFLKQLTAAMTAAMATSGAGHATSLDGITAFDAGVTGFMPV